MKATQKYIRTSPRKLRLVADAVRRLTPLEALRQLKFVGKRAADPLCHAIRQAVSNAKNNTGAKEESLRFKTLEINEGATYKRFRAVSRGMAHKIMKRSSHIRVILEEQNGQKVNPKSFRLGVIYKPSSRWYAGKKDYARYTLEDLKLKKYIFDKLKLAGIVDVSVERSINVMKIVVDASRPGVIIGRGGSNLDLLKVDIEHFMKKMTKENTLRIALDVREVKNPDTSAKLVGERISEQLIKRYPHRRAITQAQERVMAVGAKGIKIQLSGRINGAEIARQEKYSVGTIPTQTLRSDIDYAIVPSLTRSGYIGIKVWIYKGEATI